MRNFKFRVWCISYKQFLIPHQEGNEIQPWTSISFSGEIMYGDNQGSFVDSNQEDYIIQQFTGLKDKNDKDIYEGDIVNDLDKEKGIIEFANGSFIVKINNIFIPFWSLLVKEDSLQSRVINSNCFEILGNIFENPELLK